jgi:hypothetical protein
VELNVNDPNNRMNVKSNSDLVQIKTTSTLP